MKKRILLLVLLSYISLSIVGNSTGDMYRVWLSDKKGSEYTIQQPEKFLSQRCLDKRARYNIDVDASDLPLSADYIEQLKSKGCSIVVTSRWMNTAVVSTTDSMVIVSISKLPFVTKVERVKSASARSVAIVTPMPADGLYSSNAAPCATAAHSAFYGDSWQQIQMLNLDSLHLEGYYGEGVMIAVLDAGFPKIDVHPYINNSRIKGAYNFPQGRFSYSGGNNHGSSVLSCMASYIPGRYIGAAPEADYWLIVTEDYTCEVAVEEDYWAAGVEMADSIGVDIINSSLGYNTYDNPENDYTHDDLDGKTAFCSRVATLAAQKGLLVVSAAGNEYSTDWQKINVPSDAVGIMTVGSVNSDSTHSIFSSCGYTADGRVKPEVMAMGKGTRVIDHNGEIQYINGTSFSTPLISGAMACLWQTHPEWTAQELIDRVVKSASQYNRPDELYGYGIPNFYSVYRNSASVGHINASRQQLYVSGRMLYLPSLDEPATLAVYDTAGRMVMKTTVNPQDNTLNMQHLDRGIYIVYMQSRSERVACKVSIE